MSDILLQVENLKKQFKVGKKGVLNAVDNVSIDIYRGETLGLVGESGCGKTTLGRTILKLYDPNEGTINFNGNDISKLKGKNLLEFKKNCQIILQDPYASLDPRMTIGEIVGEGVKVHFNLSKEEINNKVREMLKIVGLGEDYLNRYAHELSGGQRQRVGIARALAVEPKFIVCDEPISALDVSIQAQITNLLIKLQKDYELTYLFISHDLSMVKYISDRIGVMYLGNLIELSECNEIFENPLHPYTKSLLSAIPIADPDAEGFNNRIKLIGEIPSNTKDLVGCKFHTRCSEVCDICKKEQPQFIEITKGHYVACHLVKK